MLAVLAETKRVFAAKVRDIQNAYSQQKALEIDAMIFELYKLTEKEMSSVASKLRKQLG